MKSGTSQACYLEAQMNDVSRSFAVAVACLNPPLRDQFATAYLLCRVADNIEDCTRSPESKTRRFADFERMLADPECAAEALASWGADQWPGLTDDERRLTTPEGVGEP
jgi:farnesyl-diphosphate farnesyltransferase